MKAQQSERTQPGGGRDIQLEPHCRVLSLSLTKPILSLRKSILSLTKTSLSLTKPILSLTKTSIPRTEVSL